MSRGKCSINSESGLINLLKALEKIYWYMVLDVISLTWDFKKLAPLCLE